MHGIRKDAEFALQGLDAQAIRQMTFSYARSGHTSRMFSWRVM